ncbi:MAG: hypothetical protein CMN05_01535 [Roseibacillus sp.]|jgi:hypothetical protein|nr:hypothetical protein [Roseibacillus sp.]MCP4729883.1 hypothetical protein [Roseibacillus sp.]MDP7307991.1 multiheme c-type cytochrome [Roseibacillus sp.]MDP7655948.1 multiheme c-type cytochrome [Roseibacillus sp.]HJM63348.1 multiheme c-type cytochrome [Roseibacillus sp.]|tara:strand:+ start:15345 stop:15914 length:570 start_codon:yes stop_codon:yes gene_type:complete
MDLPSSGAHLVRLTGLYVIGIVGFVFVRSAVEPETWSREDSYRKAALEDLAKRPSIHGGNDSCVGCHQDEEGTHQDSMDELMDGAHSSLSCESCHGPLAHHVSDDRKIGDARIDYTRMLCLNCHGNLVSLPAAFPKMILGDEHLSPAREAELLKAAKAAGKEKFYRHKKKVHFGMDCTECHLSPHDPET